RSVWDHQARVLLIDTVLRRMPIPKIFMRTQVDAKTRRSVREVVDGQQRLRAIIDFANDDLMLNRRAGEFAGFRYSTLPEDMQQQFLSYPLAVDQLLNASDTDVLEVFARLNSYTVSLNPAEKRHAKYQGDFKWAVHNAARDWRLLWEDFAVVAGRDRLRMGDDSLMAEMFSVVMKGVTDGGAAQLEKFYTENDEDFPDEDRVRKAIDSLLQYITQTFDSLIRNTPLRRPPQFLMLFAAAASAMIGIPHGQVAPPPGGRLDLSDTEEIANRLSRLAEALEKGTSGGPFGKFYDASVGTTQRISTRNVRFRFYRWAFEGGRVPYFG
ncbi:MAG: DUF262 domain-containing protein, partial [Candidatus Binatia bacterium]